MASKIQICNMALSLIKSGPIVSLGDDSQEAEACNLWFSVCLDDLFGNTEWRFLRAYKKLTQIARPDGQDYYTFAYPANCAKVIAVMRSECAAIKYLSNERVQAADYTLMQGETDRVIASSHNALTAVYIKDPDDITQLSPMLVLALAHKLAAYIAMPIVGGSGARSLARENNESYSYKLAEARTHDASQNKTTKPASGTNLLDHYEMD